MTEQQEHEMLLEGTNEESGEENWYCPTCGRRMLITWHPWKKVVLEQGDLYAAHSGGKGGVKLGVQMKQGNQTVGSSRSETDADDPYLAPWQRWLDSVDPDDLWNKKI